MKQMLIKNIKVLINLSGRVVNELISVRTRKGFCIFGCQIYNPSRIKIQFNLNGLTLMSTLGTCMGVLRTASGALLFDILTIVGHLNWKGKYFTTFTNCPVGCDVCPHWPIPLQRNMI